SVLFRDLLRIEGVLGDLDRFSRAGSDVQPISLSDCVHETIASVPSFPDTTIAINVDAEVETQSAVAAESFILKHVLQNLIVNAAEAIVAAGKATGSIDICAATVERDGKTMVDLTVRDDGIGITAENLTSIFRRGFSTKDGSRRGTGLHWCANSVAAMSGKIFAESAGLNCGAVFHILLKSAASTPAVQDALS
ncbi:MAG: HAMP domain-containing histidine kinase, partial [Rhodospirillales bacterium]|nr:HAMP domain-containing histidine kinase [Rhodospirillales bacterium]